MKDISYFVHRYTPFILGILYFILYREAQKLYRYLLFLYPFRILSVQTIDRKFFKVILYTHEHENIKNKELAVKHFLR